jgi:predicted Zn-dependent peptidase
LLLQVTNPPGDGDPAGGSGNALRSALRNADARDIRGAILAALRQLTADAEQPESMASLLGTYELLGGGATALLDELEALGNLEPARVREAALQAFGQSQAGPAQGGS